MGAPAKSEATEGEGQAGTVLVSVILSLIGFSAVIAQIVLMRELMVVFYGNEISLGFMLASWLFWTALGSSLLGRAVGRVRNPRALLATLEVALAAVFPLTILAVRLTRRAFHPMPGELLGPGPMFLSSFLILCVLCALCGLLFPAGSRWLAAERGQTVAAATGSVYLLEALGSGLGGILASLVLIRVLGAFDIVALVSLANLLAATLLVFRSRRLRWGVSVGLAAVFFLGVFPFGARRLEALSLRSLWRGFDLVESRNSLYGSLAVVETEGSRSLYENGLVVLTVPDPAAAEEAVHFALLEHPSPRRLLLLGGGINGSLAQALQHPSLEHADYAELDPAILDLARKYFSTGWRALESDPRVAIHRMDGRRYLKTSPSTYDVIILNLPDPQTAQLNRFYTREFFEEAARRLNPQGALALQLTGAENYISEEQGAFLRCIHKTLRAVFADVVAFPGDPIHFFAAKQPGLLTADPAVLVARLRERHLKTSYVREYYVPFRLTPDRKADLDAQLEARADTPLNLDFSPVAYYFDVALWSSRFHAGAQGWFAMVARVKFGALLAAVGAALAGLLVILFLWPQRAAGGLSASRRAAGLSVAAMGFTLMGLEILLLLGFQSLYGYVYHQLSLVIALFMVGMALGAWAAGARASSRHARHSREKPALSEAKGGNPYVGAGAHSCAPLPGPPQEGQDAKLHSETLLLALLQVAAAIAPAALYLLFVAFARVSSPAGIFLGSQVVFPGLALASGLLGGYQFPLASRIYFAGSDDSSAGTLYGLDLAGACLGAVALSAWLFPVFGFFKSAVLMGVVDLAPALLAAWAASRRETRP